MERSAPRLGASSLIRRLRRDASLTQAELAERVETTQSVISRLESDEYEGHSLSMLYRIAAALDRRIALTVVDDEIEASVREEAPAYVAGDPSGAGGLSGEEVGRLVELLVDRLGDRGLTRSLVEDAIRSVRIEMGEALVGRLRGTIRVGPGDIVEDVRRARARRGRAGAGP